MATILEKLFPYLMAALLALAFGAWVTKNYYGAELAKANLEHTQEMKAVSDAASKQIAEQAKKIAGFQTDLSTMSAKAQQDLTDAQTKNDDLRRRLADGSGRMYIQSEALASCTRKSVRLSRAGKLVDDTAFELTGKAGSDILDLRAEIISDRAKLTYLQNYISLLQKNGVISAPVTVKQSEETQK